MGENNNGKLELMKQLDESFRQVRRQINSEWNSYNVHGLGITHGRMLVILGQCGSLKASALAEQLMITSGGVTGIADRLIELGYIERRRGEQDRRVVMLHLTEEGKKMVELIEKVRNKMMIRLFDGMTVEEMQQSLNLFHMMSKNLEKTRQE
ncbi:MarR family winged helix-turn-helix transcriptional regulator [Paenibacillus harenae]|uniref:MarR family winged helix-turn-helix transcriptional regulator n=1 Tax=Paenibacillus harenae TaxID=306543 RepID=UPI0027938882|nr:MarR family transcriptional regulator [Paenibacillus harenae]MDQ0061360.1 DNA-binding MarR family transcriptional regulator [Paenibacillus harenae]